jgi:hypothetical protein
LPETTWSEALEAKSSHILESTGGFFHSSLHSHHEDPCGHSFPDFVDGLFCNNRVNCSIRDGKIPTATKKDWSMTEIFWSENDLKQIRARGLTLGEIIGQIETFRRGFPFLTLLRPCTAGDGIRVLGKSEILNLGELYSKISLSGRAMKFVPASGAATRMFKALLSVRSQGETDEGNPDAKACDHFIQSLKKFAFREDLKKAVARDGKNLEKLQSERKHNEILDYIVSIKGLNFSDIPKGLLPFHAYPEGPRTAFEEHLVEGAGYAKDKNGLVRIHFTVSPEHAKLIKEHLQRSRNRYGGAGVSYQLSFSTQQLSTDTLAVDLDNKPFRDRGEKLLFRPGGHGALLRNLNELEGDIVFIKNIDNVLPDRLKKETYTYKRALGGYLTKVQDQVFSYLRRIRGGDACESFIEEVWEFAREELSILPPAGFGEPSKQEKLDYLVSALNRPIRVCGMVKNQGEPGGGPFWVEHKVRGPSLQIIEASQVDMGSNPQREIWQSATHFNPVDLVCGVRDAEGRPFDLMRFTDPDTGFISVKSKDGRDLKALELPGLWNGGMAKWITLFVEVPVTTFAPVKTVLDLLRREHQP